MQSAACEITTFRIDLRRLTAGQIRSGNELEADAKSPANDELDKLHLEVGSTLRASLNRGKKGSLAVPSWLCIVLAMAWLTSAARSQNNPAPHDAQTALEEVKALDRAEKYDQAVAQWRRLLRDFPNMSDARLGLADDLALLDRCEEDGRPSSNESSPYPPTVEQATVTGICYYRRNDLPAALKHLEAAITLAPGDRLPAIFLARAYASSGRPQEGIRVLEAYQARRGEQADTLYWIGASYDQLAEQAYQTLLRKHPDSYLVLETQGDQLLQQQKYEAALAAYQKALGLAPDAPGLHFDIGNTYWRMEKFDQAASALEAELKLNPNHAQANFELGDIDVKEGQVEKGIPLLQKAVALNPSLTEAHRSLGRAFLAARRYSEALRELSIVVQAEPSDHTVHAMLASLYQRMGNSEKAAEETRKSNELMKQQMADLQRKEAEQTQEAGSAPPGP
ncbi:MAG TPA: tetratricopeptide repeat protein [Terriglobia bacterium]|nr:tetratricopeptide repeat protein [Terriglobia bacterium]